MDEAESMKQNCWGQDRSHTSMWTLESGSEVEQSQLTVVARRFQGGLFFAKVSRPNTATAMKRKLFWRTMVQLWDLKRPKGPRGRSQWASRNRVIYDVNDINDDILYICNQMIDQNSTYEMLRMIHDLYIHFYLYDIYTMNMTWSCQWLEKTVPKHLLFSRLLAPWIEVGGISYGPRQGDWAVDICLIEFEMFFAILESLRKDSSGKLVGTLAEVNLHLPTCRSTQVNCTGLHLLTCTSGVYRWNSQGHFTDEIHKCSSQVKFTGDLASGNH